jgi:glycerophosphoryl diester phosphodiesterase
VKADGGKQPSDLGAGDCPRQSLDCARRRPGWSEHAGNIARGAGPAIIGHRGAPARAPENTIAGIEAALRAGADAVELDVRRGPGGRLVLAHGRPRARRRTAIPLDEALSFLAEAERAGAGLLVDVKEEGTAAEVVAALVEADLISRTTACARTVAILRELRDAHPFVRRAWSLKRRRHAATAQLVPARGDVTAAAVAAALREGLAELVSVHRSLVPAPLVTVVHAAGGEIYAWDVDSADHARALADLGVDALIGDDPELLRGALSLR